MTARRRLAAVPGPAPRAVGYVRVSMAREEMVSPELQRTAIEEHCRRKGYQLEQVIEDLDATGRNFVRAGVQQAIEQVEGAGVAVVVVWKFSRFGRDRKGWAVNLDRVESVGGRLESATEDVDTRTSTGRFTRGMLAEIAAWESERIGDQWREAHARRLRQGLPHTGRPRFGYLYTRGEGYRPDPATAPVVQEMYTRFGRGDSARSIVRWLNLEGIPTTRGGQWTAISLYRMLDTGFAAGLLYVRAEDQHLPGAHEPIISREVWDAYNRMRRRGRRESPWSRSPAHTLSGLIRCGECRATMTCGRVKARTPGEWRRQYRCSSHSNGKVCRGTYIEASTAERVVRAWIDELADDLAESARVGLLRQSASTAARQDRSHWARLVARYDRQLVQLNLDRAEGLMPDTGAFIAARDDIAGRRDKAQAHLEDAADEVELLGTSHRPVIKALSRTWNEMSIQGRRDALRSVLREVRVNRRDTGLPSVVPIPIWAPRDAG